MPGYNDEGFWDNVKLNSPQLFVIAVALGAMLITQLIFNKSHEGYRYTVNFDNYTKRYY